MSLVVVGGQAEATRHCRYSARAPGSTQAQKGGGYDQGGENPWQHPRPEGRRLRPRGGWKTRGKHTWCSRRVGAGPAYRACAKNNVQANEPRRVYILSNHDQRFRALKAVTPPASMRASLFPTKTCQQIPPSLHPHNSKLIAKMDTAGISHVAMAEQKKCETPGWQKAQISNVWMMLPQVWVRHLWRHRLSKYTVYSGVKDPAM